MAEPGRRDLRLALVLVAAAALAGCDAIGSRGGRTEGDTTVLARLTRSPDGGTVHLVRLVVRQDTVAFEPAEVVVRPGDHVRFVMERSTPESVAFEADGLEPEAAEFVRSAGLAHGPLLTHAGETYDASFRGAPPGRYPFRSLTWAERGMRGAVVVVE